MNVQGATELPDRLARLARASDSTTVATLATDVLESLRIIQAEVSRARDDAVVELSAQGMSLNEIARLAGLTRGRVFQIVQRGLGQVPAGGGQ